MKESLTSARVFVATSLLVVSTGLSDPASAQVVIDFNGLPHVHNLQLDGPYSEDGYTLTSTTAGQAATVNGFQPNGLYLAGTTAMPQVVRLQNAANDPFDLLFIGIGDNSQGQTIVFTNSNGASRVVVHNDLAIGITFGSQWRNLAWVDITVASSPSGVPGQLTADNVTLMPTCRADFNADGFADSQDFFDFLSAFLANLPAADFNHDTVINSQDFFDYLAAFFTGCP